MSEPIENRVGVYYVPGTRVSLDSIVYAFRQGSSPETIREDFEGLSLAQVYGAIAFYLNQQQQLDAYLAQRKAEWLEFEQQGTAPAAELQARLDRARQATSRGPL